MNLASCKNCGNVIDLDKVKFINMDNPDDPGDEKFRDKDGYFDMEIDCHYNSDCVWNGVGCYPLDTWQCTICKEFNGKEEE